MKKLPQIFENEIKIYNDYLIGTGTAANTIERYTRAVKKFFHFCISKYHIKDMKDIKAKYLVEMRDSWVTDGFGKVTINITISAVKSYIYARWEKSLGDKNEEFWERQHILFGQIKVIKKARRSSKKFKSIPPNVQKKVIEAAKRLDAKKGITEHYTFVALLLTTGLRAQAYGMRVKEVDLEDNMLYPWVKGRKQIPIPIHRDLRPILVSHLSNRGYKSTFLFKNGVDIYVDDDPIKEIDNQGNNRRNADIIIKRICEEANIDPPLSCHQFRMTFAERSGMQGMDEEAAKTILGHRSLDMTSHYRGPQIEHASEQLNKINLIGDIDKLKTDRSSVSKEEEIVDGSEKDKKKEMLQKLKRGLRKELKELS